MLFNSIPFLIFFPIVTLIFYLLPHKYRWIHLLAASCFFYMFFVPKYILILLITIVIDYVAAIYIEKTEGARRKMLLIVSIVSTCMVLVIFKYLGFFNQNMIVLSHYLDFDYPVAFALFASAALDVKTKPPRFIAAPFGLGHLGKKLAYMRPRAGVGDGIAARRFADRVLVNNNNFIYMLKPFDGFMRARLFFRAGKFFGYGAEQNIMYQSAFARAGNARHANKKPKRYFDIYIF